MIHLEQKRKVFIAVRL